MVLYVLAFSRERQYSPAPDFRKYLKWLLSMDVSQLFNRSGRIQNDKCKLQHVDYTLLDLLHIRCVWYFNIFCNIFHEEVFIFQHIALYFFFFFVFTNSSKNFVAVFLFSCIGLFFALIHLLIF